MDRMSSEQPARIDFEDFVEAASRAVLRAMSARETEGGPEKIIIDRPILIGIWLGPEGDFTPLGPSKQIG